MNKLVCNSSKTKYIYFTSKSSPKPTPVSICIGSDILEPLNTARSLGVFWNCNLSMKSQVSKVCSSAALSLHKIGQLVEYLDKTSSEKLVHAFVSNNLDYSNSLLSDCQIES